MCSEAPLLPPSQLGATTSSTPPAPDESPRPITLEQGGTSVGGNATTMPGAEASAAKTVTGRAPAATVMADPAELDTRTRSAGGGR